VARTTKKDLPYVLYFQSVVLPPYGKFENRSKSYIKLAFLLVGGAVPNGKDKNTPPVFIKRAVF
jgi:predicted transposase YdaD